MFVTYGHVFKSNVKIYAGTRTRVHTNTEENKEQRSYWRYCVECIHMGIQVRIVGNSPGWGRNSHVPFKFSFALHYKLACMWRNFKQFICSFCPKLLYINMQIRLHNLYCPKPWSLVRILICSGTSIEFFFSIYFFVTGVKKLYHPLYWGSLNPCPTVYQNSNLAPRLGEIKRDKLTIHGSIP